MMLLPVVVLAAAISMAMAIKLTPIQTMKVLVGTWVISAQICIPCNSSKVGKCPIVAGQA